VEQMDKVYDAQFHMSMHGGSQWCAKTWYLHPPLPHISLCCFISISHMWSTVILLICMLRCVLSQWPHMLGHST